MLTVLMLMLGTIPSAKPLQDDGYGMCPAFQHYHPTEDQALKNPAYGGLIIDGKIGTLELDGLCHRDSDDAAIKDRKVLPKFNPDPKQKLT
jgi:hypothetical protein